jgi:enamine deaminase RidA (YjgF/YER057c/UK114 family)
MPPWREVAVRVGDMLYLAGQIGDDDNGALVPGGIEAETRQALENIRDELELRGSSLDRVVRCVVMMADTGEWQRMNEVYSTAFPRNRPARSAMGVNGLVLGARVEMRHVDDFAERVHRMHGDSWVTPGERADDITRPGPGRRR